MQLNSTDMKVRCRPRRKEPLNPDQTAQNFLINQNGSEFLATHKNSAAEQKYPFS
jgi:hypothetical protein